MKYTPLASMHGIFTYIWLIFMVNVGKYTIHGSYGYLDDELKFMNGNCTRVSEIKTNNLRLVQSKENHPNEKIGQPCRSTKCEEKAITWMSQEVSKWLVSGL